MVALRDLGDPSMVSTPFENRDPPCISFGDHHLIDLGNPVDTSAILLNVVRPWLFAHLQRSLYNLLHLFGVGGVLFNPACALWWRLLVEARVLVSVFISISMRYISFSFLRMALNSLSYTKMVPFSCVRINIFTTTIKLGRLGGRHHHK